MESNVNGGKPIDQALFRVDGSPRTAGAITVNKGGYKIADTSTTARVGDIYKAETGTAALIGVECKIIEVNTNDFTIASKVAPAATDTFYILRPVTPRYDSTGASQATIDTTGLATSANQTRVQSTDGGAAPTHVLVVGGITSGGVVQTLETNTSGHLNVADGGGSITVDNAGTFAVQVNAALPSGTNNIGDVDVLTLPSLPAGTNNIGDVDVLSLPSIPAGSNIIGSVRIDQTTPGTTNGVQVTAALPSGTNNIGDVDVLTLPSLPAGTNNIGDVDVLTLPALPAGTNNIGDVDVLTLPAIPAGTNVIGYVYQAPPPGSTNATTRSGSTTAEASRVIKASSGRLQSIVVTTSRTTDQYFQIFNSTTVPADSTAPIYVFKLPADSTISIDFSNIGVYFSTGISVSNSTTMATKTIGSADCYITAEYV